MKLTEWLNKVATIISSTNLTNGVCHKLITSRGNYSLSIIKGAGTDENTFRISVAAIADNKVNTDTLCDGDFPHVTKLAIKGKLLECMQGIGHELTGKELDTIDYMYN